METKPNIVYCPVHKDKRIFLKADGNMYFCPECNKYYYKNALEELEEYLPEEKRLNGLKWLKKRNNALKFEGHTEKNMVLLYKKMIKIGKKSYVRVVCLDILTGETFNIVDSNGSIVGMHSLSEPFASMPMLTAFTATFVCVNSSDTLNTLRIVSRVEVSGKSDINNLAVKYKNIQELPGTSVALDYKAHNGLPDDDSFYRVYEGNKFINKDIKEATLISKEFDYKYCFFLIKITDSQVRWYEKNNRFQVKVNDAFLNLDSEDITVYEGERVHGFAVLKITKRQEKKPYFSIVKDFWIKDSKSIDRYKRKKEEKKRREKLQKRMDDEFDGKMSYWADGPEEDIEAYREDAQERSFGAQSEYYADVIDNYDVDYSGFEESFEDYNYTNEDVGDYEMFDEEDDYETPDESVYLYNHAHFEDSLFAIDFSRKKVDSDCMDELGAMLDYLDTSNKKFPENIAYITEWGNE